MNLLRISLLLVLACSRGLSIASDFYADCCMQIALSGANVQITVVGEKYAEKVKKLDLIQGAKAGHHYLGLEAVPFGRRGGARFQAGEGILQVEVDPQGPVIGIEDPDAVQVQEMALELMFWDLYISRLDLFKWDEKKARSVLKFVIATQYHPERWLSVQRQKSYPSAGVINELRQLGERTAMLDRLNGGAVPAIFEFRDMLRSWGAIATESLVATSPRQADHLRAVERLFSLGREPYDAVEVQVGIEATRRSFMAKNLTRFVVSKLNAPPRTFYLVLSPKHAEPVYKILQEKLVVQGRHRGIEVRLEK